MIQFLSKVIATVFFIGYIPYAPGTFGSLAGLAFIWIFKPTGFSYIGILATSFVLGVLSSGVAEKDLGKDSKHIVIDEFVGYLAAVAFLPVNLKYTILAFFLFRFFDILKPPPIRNLEKILGGGIGIMLDDILAAIFTNIILQLIRLYLG